MSLVGLVISLSLKVVIETPAYKKLMEFVEQLQQEKQESYRIKGIHCQEFPFAMGDSRTVLSVPKQVLSPDVTQQHITWMSSKSHNNT